VKSALISKSPVRFYSLALFSVTILLSESLRAQHEVTQLLSLSRTGGQVDSTLDLRITTGNHLVEIDSLHFSDPRISAEPKKLDPLPFTDQPVVDYGNFSITIPKDIPPGRYEVRASGRNGISNPRAFLVTQLPCEPPLSISHDPNAPTLLPIGTLVQAKATNAEVDFYQIALGDEPLQIELLAQQLDSRMIGQLKLFDASGHELASARGADDADPVIKTIPSLTPGDYLLAVHDFLYRGGEEYPYQVVARPIDQADSLIVPLDAARGGLPEVWDAPSFAQDQQDFGDQLSRAEPSPSEPSMIELPFDSTFWFPDQQRDAVFQFAAEKGEQWSIEVVSQRGGQPSDPRILVQRIEPQPSGPPKLHDIVTVDDSQNLSDGAVNLFSTDPVALVSIPESGEYRLSVRDLDVGKSLSEGQAFRLRITPPDSGFDLVAYRAFPNRDANQTQPVGSRIFRGGSESIRVFAIRRDGWNGPIQLSCQGLPEGVTASEAVLAPNQSQTELTLSATDDAPGTVAPFRIVGRSEDGSIEHEAVPLTVQWGKGAGRDFIQSRIASSLWISVSPHDAAPLRVAVGGDRIAEVKKGESLKLPIKLDRREGGKAACVVRPRDLPGGVKAAEVTIPADQSDGELEFKVDPNAAAGTYSLWLQVETKIKLKPNPQALARAQAYRTHLQSLHDDPAQASQLDAIKAAIAEADKRVEAAKAGANDKELTVFLPSPTFLIRIVEP
jgi:hypothetical protein